MQTFESLAGVHGVDRQPDSGAEASDIPAAAAAHLAFLADWQAKNGGFIRLPPKSANVKLSNWVQWCRSQARKGKLNPHIAQRLSELGVRFAATGENQAHPGLYARAAAAVQVIQTYGDLGLEKMILMHLDMEPWMESMRELARKRPSSPVLRDLAVLIPEFFQAHIAAAAQAAGVGLHPAADNASVERPRDWRGIAADIQRFAAEHARVPCIRSRDRAERRLASWLIRFEHDLLTDRHRTSTPAPVDEHLVASLLRVVACESTAERLAQWYWWHGLAWLMLDNPKAGGRWHSRLWSWEHVDGVNSPSVRRGIPQDRLYRQIRSGNLNDPIVARRLAEQQREIADVRVRMEGRPRKLAPVVTHGKKRATAQEQRNAFY